MSLEKKNNKVFLKYSCSLFSAFSLIAVHVSAKLPHDYKVTQQSDDLSNAAKIEVKNSTSDSSKQNLISIKNTSAKSIKLPIAVLFLDLAPSVKIISPEFEKNSNGEIFVLFGNSNQVLRSEETREFKIEHQGGAGANVSSSMRFLIPTKVRSKDEILDLGGPDINNDGVRDDLEKLILEKYKDSEMKKSAAAQVLTAIRNLLICDDSVWAHFQATLALNGAFDCLDETFNISAKVSGVEKVEKEIKYLRNISVDNPLRIKRWLETSNKLAGQSVPVGRKGQCKIKK